MMVHVRSAATEYLCIKSLEQQHQPEHQAWAGSPLTYCSNFRECILTTAVAFAYYLF